MASRVTLFRNCSKRVSLAKRRLKRPPGSGFGIRPLCQNRRDTQALARFVNTRYHLYRGLNSDKNELKKWHTNRRAEQRGGMAVADGQRLRHRGCDQSKTLRQSSSGTRRAAPRWPQHGSAGVQGCCMRCAPCVSACCCSRCSVRAVLTRMVSATGALMAGRRDDDGMLAAVGPPRVPGPSE